LNAVLATVRFRVSPSAKIAFDRRGDVVPRTALEIHGMTCKDLAVFGKDLALFGAVAVPGGR
jgi:hypothetical protein